MVPREVRKLQNEASLMHGSILLVTMPPGHNPRDLQFFSFLEDYSLPPGMQKETIPHPQAPGRPHIRFLLHLFDPYKSKTTHFHNFYNVFLSLLSE